MSSKRETEEASNLYSPVLKMVSSRKRKLDDLDLSFPNTSGVLSSTLNDSISSRLETLNLIRTSDYRARASASPKLGSPERLRILYPRLGRTSKRRLYEPRRQSPAKKQLFSGGTTPRADAIDPVRFFCRTKNLDHIVRKVFRALDEEDLYRCSRVSRQWRSAVTCFEKRRLDAYKVDRIANKENYDAGSPTWNACSVGRLKQSTPVHNVSSAIFECGDSLTSGQHLARCANCDRPSAVVERRVRRCRRAQCGYVECRACGGFSRSDHFFFEHACGGSPVAATAAACAAEATSAAPLPYLLRDGSQGSSGYGTDLELSSSAAPSPVAARWSRSGDRDSEPSSPPKVKCNPVGSKKSKKALRRL